MKQFIFVFVLLATLLMVNAVPHQLQKRATKFDDCPLPNTPTLTVTVQPDPIIASETVSFSVFGTLDHDITAGTTVLAIEFADSTGKITLSPVYYQTFTEPFPAKSTVSIIAHNVPAPNALPSDYTIGVVIGNPDTGIPVQPIDAFGCTYAVVGASASGLPFGAITGA